MNSSKPRVAIVSTSFPIGGDSVSGLFVEQLARNLSTYSEVTVLTPDLDRQLPQLEQLPYGIRAIRYAPKAWQLLCHRSGGLPVALRNNATLYALVPGLLLAIFVNALRMARKVDFFQANWAISGVCVGLAARISHKPIITTLRGEDVSRSRKKLIDKLILKFSIILSDVVVTVSEEMAQDLEQQFPACAAKIQFIPNGIPEELLTQEHHKSPGQPVRIVSVGSLIPRKGYQQLLNAIAVIEPAIRPFVTIIGDGPLRAELTALSEHLGISDHIDFTGQLSHHQVFEELARSDIFVFTSYSEGRPNAVLEAMAASLPVISTNISGVRELVNHNQQGLLFTTDDTADLAAHITRLASSRAFREQLGKNARARIIDSNLSWDASARRYLALLEHL